MLLIEDSQFEQLVNEAWESIPEKFRDEVENVIISIEDNPRPYQLRKLKIRGSLYGLFDGVPKTAWGQAVVGIQPSKITIFKEPILRHCRTIGQLKRMVKKVLMHEVAHYFGYSESDMRILDRKLDREPKLDKDSN
jgi:predicted Zn-dependent protease with MMP-like domain